MDLKQAQAETILASVNEILESREFIKPEQELGDGDTVIGEMTDYEKAIWTAFSSSVDFLKAMVEKLPDDLDESVVDELKKVKVLNDKTDALKNFFWASLRHRLNEACYQASGIGVRSNFEIVALTEAEGESFLTHLLERLVVGLH